MKFRATVFSILLSAAAARAGLLVDPSGGNVLATTGDDIFVGPRNLGFAFNYFGSPQTQVFVNSNGSLTFGAGSTVYINTDLASSPARVAPFWDDLFVANGQLVENATSSYYAVTWNGVSTFIGTLGTTSVTAQAILFGGAATVKGVSFLPGDIALSYGAISNSNDGSFTVGLSAGDGTRFASAPGSANGTFTLLTSIPTGATNSNFILFRPNSAGNYAVTDMSTSTSGVPEPAQLLTVGSGLLILLGAKLGAKLRKKA